MDLNSNNLTKQQYLCRILFVYQNARKLKEKKETLTLYRRLALPLQKYEVYPNLCNKPEFPFYCAIQMENSNGRTLMTFDAKKGEM